MTKFALIPLGILITWASYCQNLSTSSDKLWTEPERKNLLTGLERTKNEVFSEIKGLTE